jgi:SAM-dependent methyltransferase
VRYYILDDVVDPLTGESLRVEGAEVVQRPGPAVERCARWCGYRGRPVAEVEAGACCTCQDAWIVSGELVGERSRYPIVAGIPRLLPPDGGAAAAGEAMTLQTRESFGYEWDRFDQMLPEYQEMVGDYFAIVPDQLLAGALVLDAGCGMGRWARFIGERGVRRLYAIDYSRAIDRAAAVLAPQGTTHCIQADVRQLPFRPQTFDFIYSLGVLHHLVDPDRGMSSVIGGLKREGSLLVFLYYALDNRPAFFRWLLRAVTVMRQVTSRLPKPVMYRLAWLIGVGVYWPLARVAGALERGGLGRIAKNVPLYWYHQYSLKFMIGDAFDRFATPVEKRYSRRQIRAWLARYGFEVRFSDTLPYWVALAKRPH